jgi:C-terminal processing protease CtpA/Prc
VVEEDVGGNNVKQDHKDIFPTAQFYTFEMPQHRPLGCTVEESMDALENYVFVSKVIPGGFADHAGIHVGDVIVAVTGLFEDMTTVLESGVEKL